MRGAEKLVYLCGVPALVLYGGYLMYKKNVAEAEQRSERVIKTEEKYLATHKENMIKLQNFNKKVFAIGVYDDILDDPDYVAE